MAKLNRICNVIYELSLHTWVTASYLNYNNTFLFLTFLILIGTMLITGFPSSYYIVGYNISKKRIDIDALLKLLQLFIVVVIIPLLGVENIHISLLMLLIFSVLNIHNRIIINSQIDKENITLTSLHKISGRDIGKSENELLKRAWQVLLPFFLLGLVSNDKSIINILVLIIICILEFYILRKLYLELIDFSFNTNIT